MTRRRLRIYAMLGCVLAVWIACGQSSAHENRLATGRLARADAVVQIPISNPVNLNYQTRSAICHSRKQYVMTQPRLISGAYEPSDDVFGHIEDGRPWWGLEGMRYWGKGQRSIDGASEESRFIMNPFLLVGDSNCGMMVFDKSKVPPSRLRQGYFPLYCQPRDLKWWPKEGRAEVTYDARSFLAWQSNLNGYALIQSGNIQLEAINARDLGLNYIYIPPERSTNISNAQPMIAPILITQFFHCGGSCGYSECCNNMSPDIPELTQLRYTNLPARLEIWLWHDAPATGRETPDMVFVINYR